MSRAPQKQGRCKSCGFRVRSQGHDLGPHHKPSGLTKKMKAEGVTRPVHKYGLMRPTGRPTTKPASAGHGFDFSAVKSGGVRK